MHANANTLPETHAPAADLPAVGNGHPNELTIVEQLVMRAFEIQLPTLLSNRRGRAHVAFARQVAIYITHVHLGLSLTAAAQLFHRDRTTAAHACRRVEDRREDPDVDRRIEAVETALDHWVDLGHTGLGTGEAVR